MLKITNPHLFCLILLLPLYSLFSDPLLIKTIDISSAGNGKRMLLGDITGDGCLEIIIMQPDRMDDDRYIGHEVNCLTAFTLDGTRLWQIGNPANGASAGSDIPAQVYDIDGDGFNEVLACMNGKFRVFDGQSGAEEYSFSYPHKDAHDCIIIANLSGTEKPQDIILKDRYSQIWALDRMGKVLWTYKGNTGHYPWPYDFDNDGFDEIICGFDYLESNGKKIWSMDQSGHADCIWVGDIDQNPSNGTEIAVGGNDVTVYHQDGTLMWRNNQPVEPQNIAIGDFLPDQPGLEIGGQDRIDRGSPGREAIFVLSSTGETSYYQTRSGWGSIAYMCHNWNGDGTDHLMIWRGPELPALFDGKVKKVASFNDGYMMTGDMNGDGRDEIITFTESRAYIYANGTVDLSKAASGCPAPRPQQKRHYNFTRYWGGEYTPQNLITGTEVRSLKGKFKARTSKPFSLFANSGTLTIQSHLNGTENWKFEFYTIQGRLIGSIRNFNRGVCNVNFKRIADGACIMRAEVDNSVFLEKIVLK